MNYLRANFYWIAGLIVAILMAAMHRGCMMVRQERRADGSLVTESWVIDYDMKSHRQLFDTRPTTQRVYVNSADANVNSDAIREAVTAGIGDAIKFGLLKP